MPLSALIVLIAGLSLSAGIGIGGAVASVASTAKCESQAIDNGLEPKLAEDVCSSRRARRGGPQSRAWAAAARRARRRL